MRIICIINGYSEPRPSAEKNLSSDYFRSATIIPCSNCNYFLKMLISHCIANSYHSADLVIEIIHGARAIINFLKILISHCIANSYHSADLVIETIHGARAIIIFLKNAHQSPYYKQLSFALKIFKNIFFAMKKH